MKEDKILTDWFKKKDRNVMTLHLQKEREALKKELDSLNAERKKMTDFLHRMEALIEDEEKITSDSAKPQKGEKS